ncbi:MAG: winged helix-turn-helix transcriptional regulator [Spirochaetales bacterium]|nr:winged helix-turn-helix transcriptional regulator [Spirochaetales bacterium]
MDREKETIILEQLSQNKEPVKQRELAQIAGLSLGMTNGLLKRMADKGFLLMERVNSRNIKYILTAEGRKELNRRTHKYMKRTIKNVVYYREAVEALVSQSAAEGYAGISLMGKSDLDFILEWACHHYGLDFIRNETRENFFSVFSEKGLENMDRAVENAVYLGEIEIKGELIR